MKMWQFLALAAQALAAQALAAQALAAQEPQLSKRLKQFLHSSQKYCLQFLSHWLDYASILNENHLYYC